jgi:alpha 1,2-mannosyltransferase
MVVWILFPAGNSFSPSSSLPECESSQECYDLLLKKAQQYKTPHLDDTDHTNDEYERVTSTDRIKGAFVVLVRNSELYAMRSSMQYLEDRFNHKYNYPWIFLNEEPFTTEFIEMTQTMTKAVTHYGLVPTEHWSYPAWINQTYAEECRMAMAANDVVYGGSESYRHMCRYQSGFFFLHPLLDGLEYYW